MRRIIIETHSDLSDEEGAETLRFGLEGKQYEIDLTETEAQSLKEALKPYVEAGRRPSKAARGVKTAVQNPETARARAWAQSEGYGLGARGRINQHIWDAWAAAGKP